MKRIVELDAIRGLAALAIMVNHLPFSNRLTHMGAYGVDLFFVLSGYLITTIILKNSRAAGFLRAFYARRSLRIWPIYYLALIVVIVINPFFRPPFPLDAWPFYATYTQGIQNYWSGVVPGFSSLLDHTWTLALEEQYYLIWPALLLLLGPRSVVPLALLIAVGSVLARSAGFSSRILIGRGDGFALGGLLAAILLDLSRARSPQFVNRYSLSLVCVGLAALAYPVWGSAAGGLLSSARISNDSAAISGSLRLFSVTVIFVCVVGLILLFAGRRELAYLRDPRLVYLGQISYGIYLYHYPIYLIIDACTGMPGNFWVILLKFAVSLAIAGLSWRWVESPILQLKSHFDYRRISEHSRIDVELVKAEGSTSR